MSGLGKFGQLHSRVWKQMEEGKFNVSKRVSRVFVCLFVLGYHELIKVQQMSVCVCVCVSFHFSGINAHECNCWVLW